MITSSENLQRFTLHGASLAVTNYVRSFGPQIDHLLGDFRVTGWPERSLPIGGTIWPYEQSHVLKHMSPTARRVASNSDLLELYEDGERFWLVDDRWGIAEMNLLKGQWRSWILPNASIDPARCLELAMVWPMAQLLRARGLYLAPAAAVSFGDKSFLILSPFGLEPELTTLIRGGYRVIGQSWTAIREEEGRFSLLHLPGHVERMNPPGMRLSTSGATDPSLACVDLMREYAGAERRQGWCDAILVVDASRRPQAGVRLLDRAAASQTLRASWPIFELHPNRRHGQLPTRLGQRVPCYQLHLSRQPRDLLKILATLPGTATTSNVGNRAAPLRAVG